MGDLMKAILFFCACLGVSGAFATETFNGTVVEAYGRYHELRGEPCQVKISERELAKAQLSLVVGNGQIFPNLSQTVQRDALGFLEKPFFTWAWNQLLESAPHSRLRHRQRLVVRADGSQVHVRVKESEWLEGTSFIYDTYSFICEASSGS